MECQAPFSNAEGAMEGEEEDTKLKTFGYLLPLDSFGQSLSSWTTGRRRDEELKKILMSTELLCDKSIAGRLNVKNRS